MAFFEDAQNDHYIGVQWYADTLQTPEGTVLELPSLDLARDDHTKSYSILNADCIINGALLIKCRGTFWAVQSPREEEAYARNNLRFQI
jgi:hypothetical protein